MDSHYINKAPQRHLFGTHLKHFFDVMLISTPSICFCGTMREMSIHYCQKKKQQKKTTTLFYPILKFTLHIGVINNAINLSVGVILVGLFSL